MLPCCSAQRIPRDAMKGKLNGRSVEIQRLIGRVLRTVVRLDKLGERTLTVDCDVIEADGGTRTAAITGSFVALALAVRKMRQQKITNQALLTDFVSAISVGMVEGQPVLDLCYMEDSQAEVDMNVAATGAGNLIEVQGTSEQIPCSRPQFNELLDLAQAGCAQLVAIQKEVLGINSIDEN
jgi:ribonuclease PH